MQSDCAGTCTTSDLVSRSHDIRRAGSSLTPDTPAPVTHTTPRRAPPDTRGEVARLQIRRAEDRPAPVRAAPVTHTTPCRNRTDTQGSCARLHRTGCAGFRPTPDVRVRSHVPCPEEE